MPALSPPASWLAENAQLIQPGATALEVACGSGRNALFLASLGCRVHALDRDAEKIDALAREAGRLGVTLMASVMDLECDDVDLGQAAYDVIVVIHYLHRPLFPALVRALAPRGLLLYETFTTLQAARGKPTNPAFLLEPGELRRLVAPLEILREREGDFEGRMMASVAARNR